MVRLALEYASDGEDEGWFSSSTEAVVLAYSCLSFRLYIGPLGV